MNISEFFNQIIIMAQNGNWSGIWTLVLGIFATILASAGGITGAIALINGIVKLFSSKKLLAKINDIFNNTKTFFQTLFEQNKTQISDFAKQEIASLKSEIDVLNNDIDAERQQNIDLQNSLQAFIDTVLNDETLQLTYSNILQNLKSIQTDTKKIVDTSATVIDDTKKIIETKATEIVEEVSKKKKIKLKDTNNE